MKASRILLVTTLLAATVVGAAPTEDPPVFILKWGAGGSGPGEFRTPFGIATDNAGNVYVADRNNHRVQKFTGTGVFLSEWNAPAPGFFHPSGIAVSPDQLVYVTDEDHVQVFTAAGTFIRAWGGHGATPGLFSAPQGIAVDASGNVYVADLGNSRIQKFTSTGDFLLAWGTSGNSQGQFSSVIGVATDRDGNVYVVDKFNSRIQKFASDSTFLATMGGGVLLYPAFVATDPAGNVFVTDDAYHKAFKFNPAGGLLTQWGSFGTADGRFRNPTGIALDPQGSIFVAEQEEPSPDGNGRVQKFAEVPTASSPTTWGALKARYR